MGNKRALKSILKLVREFHPATNGEGWELRLSGVVKDKKAIQTLRKLFDEMNEKGEY